MKDNVDNYNRQLRQLHYVKKLDCSLPKLKTISVNCNVNSCQFEVKFCFWLIRMQHCCISDPKQNLVNSGGRDWADWANWSNWSNWADWSNWANWSGEREKSENCVVLD